MSTEIDKFSFGSNAVLDLEYVSIKNVEHGGSVGTRVGYINYMSHPVRVKSRMGTYFTIMPKNGHYNNRKEEELSDRGEFIVSVSLQAHHSERDLMINDLRESAKTSEVSRRILEAVISEKFNRTTSTGIFEVNVYFVITKSDVFKHNGLMYLTEMDVSLDFNFKTVGRDVIPHPYEPSRLDTFELESLAASPSKIDKQSLVVSMRAFDNTGHRSINDRYVVVAGEVHCLKVTRTNIPGGFTGIRIVRNNPVVVSDHSGIRTDTIEELTYEEAAVKYGVAETVEEALALGDSKAKLNNDNLKLLAENKAKDQELDELKRKHERDILAAKTVDSELHKVRRDIDHRNSISKSMLDVAKTVGAVVVAVVGFVTWFMTKRRA